MDGWAAYLGLTALGFQHEIVVHENHFVDPETLVHTNAVEAYWQRCKRRLKRINGTKPHMLPSHLDEFLWLERYGKSVRDRWDNFWITLKINYNI